MKRLLVASTSTIHGSGYLEYLMPELSGFFQGVGQLLFIPFARPGGLSHEEYTSIAAKAFKKIDIDVKGLHEFDDMHTALLEAQAIFTGGGNTFLLVSQLYRHKVMATLRDVLHTGTPYLGTSAGSNICGLTMQTTNDMPIIHPPSFKTLGMLPFNINPHYLDPIAGSKHMGETRETRIKEFHHLNAVPVLGLREGSWLHVVGDEITLKGKLSARVFEQGKAPYEIPSETTVDLQ